MIPSAPGGSQTRGPLLGRGAPQFTLSGQQHATAQKKSPDSDSGHRRWIELPNRRCNRGRRRTHENRSSPTEQYFRVFRVFRGSIRALSKAPTVQLNLRQPIPNTDDARANRRCNRGRRRTHENRSSPTEQFFAYSAYSAVQSGLSKSAHSSTESAPTNSEHR